MAPHDQPGRTLFPNHRHAAQRRSIPQHFPHLADVKPKQATQAVNTARRSFIRVEADEVTYDLHIILRYRLEKALVSGDSAP